MNARTPDTEPLRRPATDELQSRRRLPFAGPLLLSVGAVGLGAALLVLPDGLVNVLGPLFVIVSLVGLYWTVITGGAWLLWRLRGPDRGVRR